MVELLECMYVVITTRRSSAEKTLFDASSSWRQTLEGFLGVEEEEKVVVCATGGCPRQGCG